MGDKIAGGPLLVDISLPPTPTLSWAESTEIDKPLPVRRVWSPTPVLVPVLVLVLVPVLVPEKVKAPAVLGSLAVSAPLP